MVLRRALGMPSDSARTFGGECPLSDMLRRTDLNLGQDFSLRHSYSPFLSGENLLQAPHNKFEIYFHSLMLHTPFPDEPRARCPCML